RCTRSTSSTTCCWSRARSPARRTASSRSGRRRRMPAGSTTEPGSAAEQSSTALRKKTESKAPLLDRTGKASKQVTLDGAVFAAEVKAHLVHETVRAELNAQRAGTRGAKSRGLVSGGRSKPWRQKGTGRARAGSTRAPHWTGGGVAFPPVMRSFDVK